MATYLTIDGIDVCFYSSQYSNDVMLRFACDRVALGSFMTAPDIASSLGEILPLYES